MQQDLTCLLQNCQVEMSTFEQKQAWHAAPDRQAPCALSTAAAALLTLPQALLPPSHRHQSLVWALMFQVWSLLARCCSLLQTPLPLWHLCQTLPQHLHQLHRY